MLEKKKKNKLKFNDSITVIANEMSDRTWFVCRMSEFETIRDIARMLRYYKNKTGNECDWQVYNELRYILEIHDVRWNRLEGIK